MEIKTIDELRHTVSLLPLGNADALDRLVWTGVFGPSPLREAARKAVLDQCRSAGIYPASIHDLYLARGRGEVPVDISPFPRSTSAASPTTRPARCSAPAGRSTPAR